MNHRTTYFLITIALLFVTQSRGEVRQWSDESGKFAVEAELLTADENFVVLERKSDGELIAVKRKELSRKDQEFINANEDDLNKNDPIADDLSKVEAMEQVEALKQAEADTVKKQSTKYHDSIWKMSDGQIIRGRLVGFGTQDLVIKRERGKIFINDRELGDLPPAYAKIVPDVVSRVDTKEIKTLKELEAHLADNGAGPFTYHIEGIQLDLATWGAITIPISLLTASEAKQVQPSYLRWQASNEEDVSESERAEIASRERLVLDGQERYRRRPGYRQRDIKMMELNLLAVRSGVIDVWEVALYPNNAYGYPRTVVVTARDSLRAKQQVVSKYPGWRVGAIAKVNY